jgi:hypothetical protein
MHGTACLHHTILTVTDGQLQPLRSDQQQLASCCWFETKQENVQMAFQVASVADRTKHTARPAAQ